MYARRLVVASMIVFSAVALAACSSAPDEVTTTMADNGSEIVIANGGTLTVSLPAVLQSDDPSAGMLSGPSGPWQAYDPPMVLDSIETSPTEGAETIEFKYEAVAEGQGELRLWYAMPSGGLTGVETEIFSVRVIVE